MTIIIVIYGIAWIILAKRISIYYDSLGCTAAAEYARTSGHLAKMTLHYLPSHAVDSHYSLLRWCPFCHRRF